MDYNKLLKSKEDIEYELKFIAESVGLIDSEQLKKFVYMVNNKFIELMTIEQKIEKFDSEKIVHCEKNIQTIDDFM